MSATAQSDTAGEAAKPKREAFRFRHVARVTLECRTPLHLGAGEGGVRADQLIVRDANGLPLIRGTGLAGLLRVPYRSDAKRAERERIFGFQNPGTEAKGCGSRLTISDACIHDQKDVPVIGLRRRSDLERDAILGVFVAGRGEIRRHTAINHRGTARKGALFSEEVVGIGYRFTFEMELIDCLGTDGGTPAEKANWEALLASLRHAEFRLGAKTRRGYGAVKVVELARRTFDLHQTPLAGLATFAKYIEPCPALEVAPKNSDGSDDSSAADVKAILNLRPRGWWRIGDGSRDCPGPLVASKVDWEAAPAKLEDMLVIPGSAWKGALRHRTVYHYLRLTGRWAGGGASLEPLLKEADAALAPIFGEIKRANGGKRGRLIIDDVDAAKLDTAALMRLHRVKIDRFTGGAWPEALFDEEPVWKSVDAFKVRVTVPHWPEGTQPEVKEALKAALQDLAEGRLALGAGASRGQGFFEGERNWIDRHHSSAKQEERP